MKHLILGGARSGKSRLAEQEATASGRPVVYIATAEPLDGEMAERIARHRADRQSGWLTVEAPLGLAEVLKRHDGPRCLLVDCLTLWLGNLLGEGDARLAAEREALLDAVPGIEADLILVSNEVGLGIVPDNPLARRFRDEAGRLHQALAQQCDRVTFVAAGLPLSLKGAPP